MTYYECSDCGQLADFLDASPREIVRPCPACEEPCRWTLAFVDDEDGVSF